MTLTVQQCAKEIAVVPHSIRKFIRSGKLSAQKIPKGREQWTYMVNVEDWQAFVENRKAGRVSEPPSVEAAPQYPSQHHAYFHSDDPDDRRIKQAELMRKASGGCRASREILRGEPWRLKYWMAVDGSKGEDNHD